VLFSQPDFFADSDLNNVCASPSNNERSTVRPVVGKTIRSQTCGNEVVEFAEEELDKSRPNFTLEIEPTKPTGSKFVVLCRFDNELWIFLERLRRYYVYSVGVKTLKNELAAFVPYLVT
jgi:hypothetical protein